MIENNVEKKVCKMCISNYEAEASCEGVRIVVINYDLTPYRHGHNGVYVHNVEIVASESLQQFPFELSVERYLFEASDEEAEGKICKWWRKFSSDLFEPVCHLE